MKVDWPDSHTDAAGMAIGQKMARLMLNLFVIAGASALRGGTLSVRVGMADDGAKHVDISIVGETIRLDEQTAAILKRDKNEPALTPKTAQPYLTMQLATELQASVSFVVAPDTLAIQLLQPQLAMVKGF